MTYISRCEHGTPMALCRKCFPDVSEHNDWSNYKYTHPVKELTREDRLKLIGTLKWAEDLLREAGHDEAVSDVQDCLMILRKAQEK